MTSLPYKIIDLQQGSAEWLAWRRSKITASMAATIMNLSEYETPLQLYSKILSGEETPDNPSMAHGRNTETEARGWLSHHTGIGYAPVCMENVEHPWMACSLDAWNAHAPIKSAELKCPHAEKNCIYDFADIPSHYYAQLQHQMSVTGEEKMIFLSYRKSDQSGVIIEVKRDNLFIEKMIPQLKTFYDRLAAFDPPDPIDGRDIFEIDDPEAINAADQYEQLCKDICALEILKEGARNYLIDKAAGKSVKVGDLRITKVISKGRVDYSSIPFLQNLDLDPYRKPNITSWRFR